MVPMVIGSEQATEDMAILLLESVLETVLDFLHLEESSSLVLIDQLNTAR
jgi:hypothetical protein